MQSGAAAQLLVGSGQSGEVMTAPVYMCSWRMQRLNSGRMCSTDTGQVAHVG